MDQVLLDKAYDWLATQRGDASKTFTYNTGCAVFKVFDASFKGDDQATVCHSALSYRGGPCPIGVATLSNWRAYVEECEYGCSFGPKFKVERKAEVADRFYDWFINRSFYSPWISAPSFEFARDVGIVVSADAPANVMGAICTLSRTMAEHPHFAQRYVDLMDEFGMSDELAFYIAFGININSDNGYGDTNTNHTIIALISDLSYVRSFVSRTPVLLSSPYAVDQNYRKIMAMWGSPVAADDYYSTKTTMELLGTDLKPFIRAVVIPNPFARVAAKASVTRWSTDELHKIIIPALMEATNDRQTVLAA